jgi:hypothetical protein
MTFNASRAQPRDGHPRKSRDICSRQTWDATEVTNEQLFSQISATVHIKLFVRSPLHCAELSRADTATLVKLSSSPSVPVERLPAVEPAQACRAC